jgi:hypothetical protein
MWGTCIAVFRVLFVTAQSCLKKTGYFFHCSMDYNR